VDNTIDTVVGDRSRVRQILINLMMNAIKFTRGGEVTVHVRTLSSGEVSKSQSLCIDEFTVTTEFSVTDTGIGIDAKGLNLLFKPFSQASSSYTRDYTGNASPLIYLQNRIRPWPCYM
jgi:signal transduction histidine kinase